MKEIKLIKSTFYKEKNTKRLLCEFIKKSKQLSIGKECEKFEEKFSEWQGRKYCVMFNSGSSANLALIQSLLNIGKIKKNKKVGFSAITWATNVMPLMQLGLKPIPVDIEKRSLNISLDKIKVAYKKDKFDCLFLTNLLGFSDNLISIKNFCNKNNIVLIEDNCESLGSEYENIKLGNFGLASTFSFFAGHHLSTVEGGAACTDDESIYTELKMVRSHGWDRHLSFTNQNYLRKKYKVTKFYSKYIFYDLAYNLRPTEIQGFLGLTQLRYINEIIKKREYNFNKFLNIYKNSDFENLDFKKMNIISNFGFPILCKEKSKVKKYIRLCNKNKIEIRPIVGGLITKQPFYKKYIKENYNLSNAEDVYAKGFYFGNNPEMIKSEINYIVNLLK
ncbi:MAG: DegT/DnrJ/EryC1/StrS family aminotransferase [Candidatus Falkowbacteria bacterium]